MFLLFVILTRKGTYQRAKTIAQVRTILGTGGISDVEVNPLNYVIVLNGCVDTKTYLRLTIPLLLSSHKKK